MWLSIMYNVHYFFFYIKVITKKISLQQHFFIDMLSFTPFEEKILLLPDLKCYVFYHVKFKTWCQDDHDSL